MVLCQATPMALDLHASIVYNSHYQTHLSKVPRLLACLPPFRSASLSTGGRVICTNVGLWVGSRVCLQTTLHSLDPDSPCLSGDFG
ncbi:unnamed protein product [Protopolystoma xenopodis]|uniref:Uncharacterized protein n=1 Tax=Protopolystoma xenopodis TaxID=117903 RepID=A0A448WHM7_9PLAT|nr:unnamed protein product [Protopolystoma xenopodis]